MITDNGSGRGIVKVDKYKITANQKEEDLLHDISNGLAIPYESVESKNLWLNTGWNEILKLVTGESINHFNAANTRIGVGDSSTAASASQTDLQAATNKTYKTMEAGYPTAVSAQSVDLRARFTSAEANYVWAEAVIKNVQTGVCWDRVVDTFGTKTNTEIWYLTISIGMA